MNNNFLRIATRKSPLAIWQAEYVRRRLSAAHPGLRIELVRLSTQGDRITDSPLAQIGGKGLFVKELEEALLDERADLAVHSMKDVPVTALPSGLHLSVICEREDPRDALISLPPHSSLEDLPREARVGTSSLRRQAQIKALRPDLNVIALRGNVNTRIAKFDQGDFDAIVLAAAGLKRLGYEHRIGARLPADTSLPAVGQGAIGIECRAHDLRVNAYLAVLDDPDTHICITAERAFNRRLEGGCQVPIAGYAVLENDQIWLRGFVGRPDGRLLVRGEVYGPQWEAERLGKQLAEELLSRGAKAILDTVHGGA